MPKFFAKQKHIFDDEILLFGDDAHQIKDVLRMKKGAKIIVCDNKKTDYECEIIGFGEDFVKVKKIASVESLSEPPIKIRLYQCLAKADKFDFIVQKSVEMGVCEIVPVASRRCVVRLDKKSAQKKIERWQKISEAAAKQSGRGTIPEILPLVDFETAVNEIKDARFSFICYEKECESTLPVILKDMVFAKGDDSIAFIIGPEGGFDDEEITMAKELGIKTVSLGHRILRCESASAFVLSCIAYENEL